MENLMYGIGMLLAGLFGTNEVQKFRSRRNGQGGADRIVKAIGDEGSKTRSVLHAHNESTRTMLATMNKECSTKHAELLGKMP